MKFKLVICGGTFDRLHAGHKAFLRFAFTYGETVTIGVTSDAYVYEYKKDKAILPFAQREKEVKAFLRSVGFLTRAKVVPIDSRFDETKIPDASSVALLVSEETQKAGEEINIERKRNNLSPFHTLVFPMVVRENGEKISSSTIRAGIITREGILLPDKTFIAKKLFLPDDVREMLRQPFGILFTGIVPKQFLRNSRKIVTVGDVITKKVHEAGVKQALSIIDFTVERKKTQESLSQLGFEGNEKIIHITNPAGQLSPALWKKLHAASQHLSGEKQTIVVVEGEEDLFVIPLILMLPLGAIVMYGQPSVQKVSPEGKIQETKEGVVILEVTENLKQKTYNILRQFVPK